MLPVLNVSGPRLEVNALFLQPTRWCAINCKGCYVKEHEGGENGYHTPYTEQEKLFRYFYNGEIAWANQITVAIDNLPAPEADAVALFGHVSEETRRYAHMVNIFQSIIDYIEANKTDQSPEVHMTFNSDLVFEEYTSKRGVGAVNTARQLSVLSFSNIKRMEYVKYLAKHTHVNYNHLIPGNVTSFNIDKHVERMTRIGEIVDSIYMVIFKSPVGAPRTELVQVGDQSRMRSDLSYIRTMMERLPEHVRRKINVDGCLKDTVNSFRTGFGCSSNVSRFQVWPDGTVSGCPYAFSQDGQPTGKTAEDIMANIRAARKRYDFRDRCHLPETYNSLSK